MTEKTPRRLRRRVPDPRTSRSAPGDPVPWDPSTQVRDRGHARPAPRRQGQGDRRGDATRSTSACPECSTAASCAARWPRPPSQSVDLSAATEDAGRQGGAHPRRARREGPLRGTGGRGRRRRHARTGAEDALRRHPRLVRAARLRRRARGVHAEPGAPLVFEGKAETKTSAGDVESAEQGPRQERQRPRTALDAKGQRRAGLRAGRRGRRGYLRHAGPDAHRPGDPRPRGAVGRRRADGLGLDAGPSSPCATSSPRRSRFPSSKVRVITEYMGGGFGAKFGARIEGVTAARLAKEAGAPVKLFLDRKEEQLATGNRPSSVQTIKAGATKDGKLTALQLTVHGDGRHQRGHGHFGPDQEHLRLRQRQDRGVRRLHQRRPVDRHARARAPPGRLRPRGDDGRARRAGSAWTRSSSA